MASDKKFLDLFKELDQVKKLQTLNNVSEVKQEKKGEDQEDVKEASKKTLEPPKDQDKPKPTLVVEQRETSTG